VDREEVSLGWLAGMESGFRMLQGMVYSKNWTGVRHFAVSIVFIWRHGRNKERDMA